MRDGFFHFLTGKRPTFLPNPLPGTSAFFLFPSPRVSVAAKVSRPFPRKTCPGLRRAALNGCGLRNSPRSFLNRSFPEGGLSPPYGPAGNGRRKKF